MPKDYTQPLNQAVFRIMERVYGQTDLNTLFTEIGEIITDLMENCLHNHPEGGDLVEKDVLIQYTHDLRTQMNGVLGFSALLREELKDPGQKLKVDNLLLSTTRIMEILEEITQRYGGAPSVVESGKPLSGGSEPVKLYDNPSQIKTPAAKGRKGKGAKLPDVLIVEDNMVNIQLLMIYLRKYCNIFSIRNAKAAIEMASQQRFSAIFMDIHLGPGMNGIEAMHEIRKIEGYGNIPVIAVTGYASYGDREHFLKEGFTDYIKKPIDRDVIREVMDRLINKQSL